MSYNPEYLNLGYHTKHFYEPLEHTRIPGDLFLRDTNDQPYALWFKVKLRRVFVPGECSEEIFANNVLHIVGQLYPLRKLHDWEFSKSKNGFCIRVCIINTWYKHLTYGVLSKERVI